MKLTIPYQDRARYRASFEFARRQNRKAWRNRARDVLLKGAW